jgi:predicted transposase YbfD/YdcC
MSLSNLITHLGTVPDPRIDRGKLHRLDEMLFVAICAIISGAEGWSDIEEFGRNKLDWLLQYVKLENGVPVDDTFARVFSKIAPKAFRKCLVDWTNSLRDVLNDQVVAIDGKTARRSHDRKRGKAAVHLVRAWATEQGVALGMVSTDVKSNEITAIPELLELLDISGAIVTIDAMGCQRDIADKIVSQGGDYLLAVKDNQRSLHEEIQDFFTVAQANEFDGVPYDYYEATDGGHGRVEHRRCWVSNSLSTIGSPQKWRGLTSIVMMECERHTGDTMSVDKHFYITSLAPDAKKIALAKRAHWGIENSCHWVLDVTFREDDSRIRRDHGAENIAILRQMAFNTLKQDKTKISMRKRRIRAAQNDVFRSQLIESMWS